MNALGIAIDGGRYVRFNADFDNGVSVVHLQTLGIGADSARLDFVSFNGGSAVLRRSCVVSGLKRRGKPGEIRVQVERRSRFVWRAVVTPRGAAQFELKIRTGRALWPLLLLLIPAALILLFRFAFPLRSPPRSEDKQGSTQPGPPGPSNRQQQPPPGPLPGLPLHHPRRLHLPLPPGLPLQHPQRLHPGLHPRAATSSSSETSSAAASSESASGAVSTDAASSSESVSVAVSAPVAGAGVVFPVTIFFAPESAFLNAEARALLDKAAESLPQGAFILRVEGHSADFGTHQGRVRLSRRRARAAADYLISRIGRELNIESEGFGVDRPATEDPLLQNLNRRVEIHIKSKTG